jgi:hypothetical protein
MVLPLRLLVVMPRAIQDECGRAVGDSVSFSGGCVKFAVGRVVCRRGWQRGFRG